MTKTEIATKIRLLKLNLLDSERRMKLGKLSKEHYKSMEIDVNKRIKELRREQGK